MAAGVSSRQDALRGFIGSVIGGHPTRPPRASLQPRMRAIGRGHSERPRVRGSSRSAAVLVAGDRRYDRRRRPAASALTIPGPMTYVALAVSGLALGFTIASFWWLHARTGSLEAAAPRSYAFADKVRVRLPFAFFNTGSKALIVTDLRLLIDNDPDREPLGWI